MFTLLLCGLFWFFVCFKQNKQKCMAGPQSHPHYRTILPQSFSYCNVEGSKTRWFSQLSNFHWFYLNLSTFSRISFNRVFAQFFFHIPVLSTIDTPFNTTYAPTILLSTTHLGKYYNYFHKCHTSLSALSW